MAISHNINHIFKSYIPGTVKLWESPGRAGWVTCLNYEEKHFPIDFPDPVEALKYIMEWNGITSNDLEPYIGTKAAVLQILERKKEMTVEMIMRLKKGLKISADLFVPESKEDVSVLA